LKTQRKVGELIIRLAGADHNASLRPIDLGNEVIQGFDLWSEFLGDIDDLITSDDDAKPE